MADHWKDITKYYSQLSDDWFKDVPKYQKAMLRRLDGLTSNTDRFCRVANAIYINAPVYEIDLPDVENQLCIITGSPALDESQKPWPGWKKILVHEVLHEYESKAVKQNVTKEGQELCEMFKKHNFYPPEKHGASFYTAIADRAQNYFYISAEELWRRV